MEQKFASSTASNKTRKLPEPEGESRISVETALLRRRSIRQYQKEALTIEEVSRLLWAAQGENSVDGFRTAPSAGATYPLTVYLVAGDVEGLNKGIYRYLPDEHGLEEISPVDPREGLCAACLHQEWVRENAAAIAFAARYKRTTSRYGERGIRYVHMEAGHAQQNVHLQAAAMDIGTVVVGAFHDEKVKRVLGLPEEEEPLSIMPLGRIE